MDLTKIKKGLFAVKEKPQQKEETIADKPIQTTNDKITVNEDGFRQASTHHGSIAGFHSCLHTVYHNFRRQVQEDIAKQEELKRPYKVKIAEHRSDIERLEKKMSKIQEEYLPATKTKIEKLKEEVSSIKKNPQEVIGDDAGNASFFIGGVILVFLTIYLFVFYSSASYSAFFKEFSINEIGVANSIFDAQALSKAFKDGFTELALILTIPFVFLGLGFLIHKFQEQAGASKYLKIAMLILITFLFDSILAYEITEKIYNIKKDNSFNDVPDYTLSMAFQAINFWLVIFAGFVVYLIWGFVFDFVMEAYAKIDKVKVAIQEKEKQISEAEKEQKNLQTQIDEIVHSIDENRKEISKHTVTIEGTIVPQEFEQTIFGFSTGWIAWLKQSGSIEDAVHETNRITQDFVKANLPNYKPVEL